jgi:hypothetical protein
MSFLGAQNSIALGVQGIIAIDTGTGAPVVVTDPYWANVSMLLHGDGVNAAKNNTFLDGSTNNFTVTRNGNTTQGSFNPFVSTYPYDVATNGGSGYFDGAGDNLTVPANAALNLGTNDFTIECWINTTSISATEYIVGQGNSSVDDRAYQISVTSAGAVSATLFSAAAVGTSVSTSGGVIAINTWYHIALVSNSDVARLYVGGVQRGAVDVSSLTINPSTSLFGLGSLGAYAAGQTFNGYISNFRLINGTCLYPSGTTFTPPTAPLTAVTNTALLLGMSNAAIFDNAILNNLETVADAQISTSVFKYGTGSMKFDGTGDRLSTPAKTAFNLGTNDFTIECWINTTSISATQYFVGQGSNTLTDRAYQIAVTNTGAVTAQVFNAAQTSLQTDTSSSVIAINTWYHIAFVRDGNTVRLYVGGVQGGTGNVTGFTINPSTSIFGLGALGDYNASSLFNGYIDDFRFTKGICRYPSGTTFTPPTAAFPNS